MIKKISNNIITILSVIVIIIISLYFINEFRTKEIDGKIIGLDKETFTILSKDNTIYTFNYINNFKLDINKNIKIKYNKKLSNFIPIQNVNIKNISEIKNFEIIDDSMFIEYQTNAKKIVDNMTVEEKVGQLLLARIPVSNDLETITNYNIGGYILFERDINNKTKEELINKINEYQNTSSIPLLIAIDEEGGTVSRLSSNKDITASPFLSPQELYKIGGYNAIEKDTINKNIILKELGINVNLAPIADTTTSSKSYMYKRSFGQDAKETSKYIETVIKNTDESVTYVLKHFPGYGDNENTHKTNAIDIRTYKEFKNNDFLPFKRGIENGAQAILVSHNYIQNIDYQNPASLSANIHNILKQELQFKGIIMTDDLNMKALNNIDKKYIKSLLAGNNIIIVSNYTEAYYEIYNGIMNNEISEDYIEYLITKTIAWKYYKNLF